MNVAGGMDRLERFGEGDFLQRELLSPGTTVGPNDDLLAGEVLDSIDVLRLAAFVAEAFRIEIRPADFVIENFRTVATIAAYVERTVCPGAFGAIMITSRSARGDTWP